MYPGAITNFGCHLKEGGRRPLLISDDEARKIAVEVSKNDGDAPTNPMMQDQDDTCDVADMVYASSDTYAAAIHQSRHHQENQLKKLNELIARQTKQTTDENVESKRKRVHKCVARDKSADVKDGGSSSSGSFSSASANGSFSPSSPENNDIVDLARDIRNITFGAAELETPPVITFTAVNASEDETRAYFMVPIAKKPSSSNDTANTLLEPPRRSFNQICKEIMRPPIN